MSDDYGIVTLDEDTLGVITVTQSDPTIGIPIELLSNMYAARFDMDGYLVIGDVNAVTYHPVKFAHNGRTIICERID